MHANDREVRLHFLAEQTAELIADRIYAKDADWTALDSGNVPPELAESWMVFGQALEASAATAAAVGESYDAWEARQTRRWGTPLTAHAALLAIEGRDPVEAHATERLAGAWRGLPIEPHELSRDPRTDIPSQRPAIEVPTWAGISDSPMVLQIDGEAVAAGLADLSVLLPRHRRGAHMSRLQEALSAVEEQVFASPLDCTVAIAKECISGQESLACRARLSIQHKHRTTTRHSSLKTSTLVRTEVEVELERSGREFCQMSVTVDVMTACPCTLEYSQLRASEATGGADLTLPPTFTHSQPGTLCLGISGDLSLMPSHTALFSACAQAAHLRESLLKRPDEHDLVERAHLRPQFSEDLARAGAAAIASRVGPSVRVTAEASLLESIHSHKAIATVEGLSGEFWIGAGSDE